VNGPLGFMPGLEALQHNFINSQVKPEVIQRKESAKDSLPKHITNTQDNTTRSSKRYSLRDKNLKVVDYKDQKPQHKKLRCHHCRSRDIDKTYTVCGAYPDCRCGFCHDCLKDIFNINPKTLKKDWRCLVCEENCFCQRCKDKVRLKNYSNSRVCIGSNRSSVNQTKNLRKGMKDEKEKVGKRKSNTEAESSSRKKIKSEQVVIESSKEFSPMVLNPSIIYPFDNRLARVNQNPISYYQPMVSRPDAVAPYFMNPGTQFYPSYVSSNYPPFLPSSMSEQPNIGHTTQTQQIRPGASTVPNEISKNPNAEGKKD